MHDVIELSWWILRHFWEIRKPITHLELQKILCHLQRISIKKYNKKLFQDKIRNTIIGENVERVYYELCIYSSIRIIPTKINPDVEIALPNDLVEEMYNKLNEIRWYEQAIDKESKNYLD